MTRKKHLLAVFLLLSTCLSFMRAVDEVEIPVESSPEFSGEQTPLPSVQESPQSDSQPMSGLTLQTGEFTPFIPTPRLVISEVFFDGSDERFEIANIGSGGFSGELIIQGAKSSDVHIFITLGSGEVGVRGDTMSQISDKKVIRGSGLGLSISDTLALNMSLLISGQIADTFSLPAGTVSSLPNLYGFEKVRSGGELHILSTSTGRVANISGTRVANPGVIRTLQPSVVESTGIVSDPPIPAPPPATGETTTWSQSAIPLSNPLFCGAKTQNTTPFYVGNSVNLIATASGTDIQNSSTRYSCQRSVGESTFTGCNPSYMAFSGAGIYRAIVDITSTDGQRCKAETRINYPAKTSSTTTTTPSAEDIPLATLVDPGQNNDSLLRISSVLPDAEGKDDGSEEITIELLSGENISLDDFIVRVNTKKTALHGQLVTPGESLTFKSTFGMVNKPACVTLEKNGLIFDRFCYGQPKAGQRITLTGDFSDAPGLSWLLDFSWVKELRIALFTGEACSVFDETLFDCVPVKPLLDEKKKAQYEKKLASLQKKYDKKQQQYTGLQARYKKTKADLDAKWRKYYQQVKTVRASYKQKVALAELEKKIRKNYGKLLGSYLKKNWQIVREHSDVAFISSVLDANLTALSGADSTSRIHLDGQEFKLGDLQKQYQYATDPALRADMLVQNLLKDINPDLAERWAQWLEQRYGE